jgi:Na+/H+ antiporter NhaD/arsenite permease-like protein
LLAIATLPLISPHWWERNRNKALISAIFAAPLFCYFAVTSPTLLGHTIIEYFAFIVFLWSLYTIAGGIVISGDLQATPQVNTLFLALGALLANFIGTTGASMVLIYPLIRTNSERHHIVHTFLFFIFIVSNSGGCLLPIGDPPLFLGFLRGIPFFWTLEKLFFSWLFINGILLLLYFIWDSIAFTREDIRDIEIDQEKIQPILLHGKRNLFLLGGVILAVIFIATPWREFVMIALGLASWRFTAPKYRQMNRFSWHAITEVAILFIGIFVTMIPALQLLQSRGSTLGISHPWQFFWSTGILSSFLDNAPTFLAFTSLASGVIGTNAANLNLLAGHDLGATFLQAIATGAVFMGANTYIGNAPNFMVKAICEQQQVKMPSFFGYMLYSGGILIPLFLLYSLIFF